LQKSHICSSFPNSCKNLICSLLSSFCKNLICPSLSSFNKNLIYPSFPNSSKNLIYSSLPSFSKNLICFSLSTAKISSTPPFLISTKILFTSVSTPAKITPCPLTPTLAIPLQLSTQNIDVAKVYNRYLYSECSQYDCVCKLLTNGLCLICKKKVCICDELLNTDWRQPLHSSCYHYPLILILLLLLKPFLFYLLKHIQQ
jgi:hypothetical protein